MSLYRVEVEVDTSTTPPTVHARAGLVVRRGDLVRVLASEISGVRIVSRPFGPFVRYHVALATTDGRRIAIWPFARFSLARAREDKGALERLLQAIGVAREA